MKHINIERAKAAAGILLVGVGILILRQHLNEAVIHVNKLLGSLPAGMLPIVVMDSARQTRQSSGSVFLLQHALGQIFVAFWPLLLVRAGMALSTECQGKR